MSSLPMLVPEPSSQTDDFSDGPLRRVESIAEIESYPLPDPSAETEIPDLASFAQQWPDHARVVTGGAMPLFWESCRLFGMEEALVRMRTAPDVYETLIHRLTEHSIQNLFVPLLESARGYVDIFWFWDDSAGQHGMIVYPELWRARIKPYMAKIVRIARDYGFYVMFHSCGSVRPVLQDLIEMGVNALEVFQINASGMDPKGIAEEFGGDV